MVAPNGIICHLFWPLVGRRHDAFMLRESGLLDRLDQKMVKANGEPYVIYGDPAYPVRRHIIAPFRGACRWCGRYDRKALFYDVFKMATI